MNYYLRTITCLAVTAFVGILLLTGCTDHIPDTTQKVGGGSIDNATGRITIGGCVSTPVREASK